MRESVFVCCVRESTCSYNTHILTHIHIYLHTYTVVIGVLFMKFASIRLYCGLARGG